MRYFTADLHLGHSNIIDFCDRPFKDTDHMDTELVRRWNAAVMPDDEVYVLGDLAMGRIEHSLEVAARMQGHKRLLPGNHDRCWRGGKKDWKTWIPRYQEAGFVVCDTDGLLSVGAEQVEVYLCHFPPVGDSRVQDRYSAWRPDGWPDWLLHGHVHNAWRQRGKWINVGVDVWNYAPVAESAIVEMVVGSSPMSANHLTEATDHAD